MAYPKVDPMTRFMRKVEADGKTGCWRWRGGTSHGYAMFGLGPQKTVRAARWIYTETKGPIPEGLTLDHVWERGCRYRDCVNPDHLEPVTIRTNILRSTGPAALNARKTHCAQGHEYTEENTYRTKAGKRTCRQCNRERCLRNYYKKKAAKR